MVAALGADTIFNVNVAQVRSTAIAQVQRFDGCEHDNRLLGWLLFLISTLYRRNLKAQYCTNVFFEIFFCVANTVPNFLELWHDFCVVASRKSLPHKGLRRICGHGRVVSPYVLGT